MAEIECMHAGDNLGASEGGKEEGRPGLFEHAGQEAAPPVIVSCPPPLPPPAIPTESAGPGDPLNPELPPLRQTVEAAGKPWWRRYLGPIGAGIVLLLKFGAKLKFLLPLLKFIPTMLKTGGTMFLSIWVYATIWGWWFAAGFVLLLLIHECGHLVAARQCGLNVGAPVFIPFMGAFIALKDAPKNAWIEAKVGIGGPLLGTAGAAVCYLIYIATGQELFRALAYVGFFLNLFNLAPIGFLDGGRVVTAISPWLWLVGAALMVGFLIVQYRVSHQFNLIVLFILLLSMPRVFSLFRKKKPEEEQFFEIELWQRLVMSILYFGLVGALVLGMILTHFHPTDG